MLSKLEAAILTEDIQDITNEISGTQDHLESFDTEQVFRGPIINDLNRVLGLLGCLNTKIEMAGTTITEEGDG